MDKQQTHHVSELRTDIAHATEAINACAALAIPELTRLHLLVAKPGWTTIAEFVLVQSAVRDVTERAQRIAHAVTSLTAAADKVGQRSGVIITEG